jgi:hypothetical protein
MVFGFPIIPIPKREGRKFKVHFCDKPHVRFDDGVYLRAFHRNTPLLTNYATLSEGMSVREHTVMLLQIRMPLKHSTRVGMPFFHYSHYQAVQKQ